MTAETVYYDRTMSSLRREATVRLAVLAACETIDGCCDTSASSELRRNLVTDTARMLKQIGSSLMEEEGDEHDQEIEEA